MEKWIEIYSSNWQNKIVKIEIFLPYVRHLFNLPTVIQIIETKTDTLPKLKQLGSQRKIDKWHFIR